ncbi:MAG: hypothetical protein AMXMBFR84_15140 [Candidatus Hydrogenedentota bacterium]
MYRAVLFYSFWAAFAGFATAAYGQTKPLDFNRDIRPILADNCFHCHGRDANQRKAGLRLDVAEEAKSKGAVVPGNSDASELVKRITSGDPSEKMPPPDSKRVLDSTQIEKLVRWVREGAEYKPHWAFIPLADTPLPDIRDSAGWAKTPVDLFILERLQAEGLTPSPQANKEILIRRVSMDLTGLPPSLEEIDAFLADEAPGAYERLVDRLLESPAYGERMTNEWLDLARYGDTYGYQADVEMFVWPWRDWVIRAFTENMPYDQFVTWQLAGDLLPNPSQDQVLATTFNRLHRQTNEGGSIPEEFRVAYVADRANTFSTAFLGLTMDCARCHDHKFDPISQRDYYSLFSFFNNLDESGMYSHFTNATPSPGMFLTTEESRAEHVRHMESIQAKVAERAQAIEPARERFVAWRNSPDRNAPPLAPIAHLPFDEISDGKTPNTSTADKPADVDSGVTATEGKVGHAALFSGEDAVKLAEQGKFERCQPFSIASWIRIPGHTDRMVVCHASKASLDAASRGYELLLNQGRPEFALNHFWPGNAVRVTAKEAIPIDAWTHVAVTYDGSSKASGIRLFMNGTLLETEVIRDNLYKTIMYADPKDSPALHLGQRFRDNGFTNGLLDEFMVFDREISSLEVESIAGQHDLPTIIAERCTGTDPAAEDSLFAYYLLAVDPAYRDATTALQVAREIENTFIGGVPEIMVMRDMPEPRQAYVLARGAYDHPTDPVQPSTPESIMPFGERPANRLGLAQWLFEPDHPLTARVAVNRYWLMVFGRGLVETQEDFGTQGRAPSHPDLLDWLAKEYRDSSWDTKQLLKLIVMSATYRQDSTPRPDLTDRDPHNVLLARGPRQRLSAELIRDNALAASSLLVTTVGGPSVKPYQPTDLWIDASGLTYVPDSGDGLYRKSMYTYWKRTVHPVTLATFDAPNREVCTVRREVTATPLQSLILLNDPQYIEASRVLAEKAMDAHSDVEARLTHMYRALTSQSPSPEEAAILQQAYDEQVAYYTAHAEEAIAYTDVGERPRREDFDPAQYAAATAVAQLIMNVDAFQTKY